MGATAATLHVKPGPGLAVRDPISRAVLPPDGAHVADSTYWHRRIAEGDVTLVQPAIEPASKPARTPRSNP